MAIKEILVPDIGDFNDVAIIDILVAEGDQVEVEQPLITLESDKASMDIPCSDAGVVKSLKVALGDKLSEGSLVLLLETTGEASAEEVPAAPATEAVARPDHTPMPSDSTAVAPSEVNAPPPPKPAKVDESGFKRAHASPSVRRFARELGVDLTKIAGSGRKARIVKQDVQSFVKQVLTEGNVPVTGAAPAANTGAGIPEIPAIDFSKFGEIETVPLGRIKKISGTSLHRSWLNVPHVTQFDEADITDLEAFRKSLKAQAEQRGVKLTFLAFLLKACAAVLREYPNFNASLDPSKENLILKKYVNIGVAVDTPNGLVVPVVRDVDKKGLFDIAADLGELSKKARDGKLGPKEMQGACFTISSLGGIGGTAFTPIVNAPEVAILGVSRSKMQPVYQDNGEFAARMMLPLSLSYDHRVIDGAAAARFTSYLGFILADVRCLLL